MIRSSIANAPKHDYAVLDLGFLAGLILDTADIPKGPLFTANAALRVRCHGRYIDCSDQAVYESYLSFAFDRLQAISH